jgi:hypothetical protein
MKINWKTFKGLFSQITEHRWMSTFLRKDASHDTQPVTVVAGGGPGHSPQPNADNSANTGD